MRQSNIIKIIERFILLLVITAFLSDFGIMVQKGDRPLIAFSEILVIVFILFLFLYKTLQNPSGVSKTGLKIFLSILGIIVSASIGAILHLSQIDLTQHIYGVLRLILWAVFFLLWADIAGILANSPSFPKKVWKYYLTFGFIISGAGIFQYIFHLVSGQHLNLNPFFQQHWGVYGGYYRATSIFQEPSFLGVMLVPIFIAEAKLFFVKGNLSHLIKSIFLLGGILVSFSLGSFIVVGVWMGIVFFKWLYCRMGLFLRTKTDKREIESILAVSFVVLIACVIFSQWIGPLVIPRIEYELKSVQLYHMGDRFQGSSGAGRFSSYEGFLMICKQSPLFGVGFDQTDYIESLLGKTFQTNTGSGIFGFIGTSAGILGVVLILLVFKIVFQGYNYKEKVREARQSNLLIVGRAIVVALVLEQLISYGGILNPDFWLPLAFSYLFIIKGQKEIKDKYEEQLFCFNNYPLPE